MATVLVVDDRVDDRRLLASILAHGGHQVLEASEGATALAVARHRRPDLIVTDLLLPLIDGYELVRRLRADPSTGSIRVVLYSAHYNVDELHRFAKEHHVQLVLTKPVRPEALLENVAACLAVDAPEWAPVTEGGADEHARLVSSKLLEKVTELEAANRDIRRLLAAVVDAQEQERARIARDVHDDPVQVLTAVLLRTSAILATAADPVQRQALEALEGAVEAAVGRLRRLLFDLRPPALDAGLGQAVGEALDVAFGHSSVAHAVKDGVGTALGRDVALVAFRIAQEAILNASRHAQATQVTAEIDAHDDGVLVTIVDDGIGFDAGTGPADRPAAMHLGMIAMRERAELACGWFAVSSDAGAGTTLRFWLPAQIGG
jgi:signal transduction histidine kinase